MSTEYAVPSNYYNKSIQLYENAINKLLIEINSIKTIQVNHPENDYTDVINQYYNKINHYYKLLFNMHNLTQ